ncbi:MAG TPA: hybrid sensor histidine kinase/response regulator [Cyanophyceae cyanobacterium]
MPTPNLKEIAEPVPVCEQTADLAALLEIFRHSGGDIIVVLSEQQLPLGVVHLRQVMPHLFSLTALGYSPASMSTPQLHKSLFQLQPPVVEPLVILSAQMSLSQFWTYLQESDDQSRQWALVEEDGTFLGLLNSCHLLKALTLNVQLTNTPFGSATQSPANSLNPLAQLLEQLPLPLSVQTATGQVVAQNHTWRQQIGKSPDVDWVRRTTATMLDVPSVGSPVHRKSDSKRRQRSSSKSGTPTTQPAQSLPRSQTGILDPSLRPNASATLGQSPLSANRGVPPGYEPIVHRPVERYCALDTPRMAVTVSQRHLLLSTPPSDSQNDSVSASETQRQHHDHVFSFVKMPLSSAVAQQEPKDCEEQTTQEDLLAQAWKQTVKLSQPEPSYNLIADTTQSNVSRIGSAQPMAEATTPPNLEPNKLTNPQLSAPQTQTPSQLASGSSSDLWLVLAQDTTEQEQVAKELAAKNADLVQLNRLKDEFLACISHELKTPLTAVLGLSSLLKDQALGTLNERQARYARLIYQSGRQLMTIVNDILDLTRMETGQMELTLEPVQIQTVCDRAHTQARQRPSEKDHQEEESTSEIRFTLEIEPGLKTIVADELRLRQMLVNLLSNALKFTDSTGEIGLKVNRWDGWIAFTVWDTGIGIPAEKQHLIFQKFQQLENPLTRRFEGTGLGLVLTQRLARLHGGDISFISKAGEGSHFTLLLPPCPPQSRGKAPHWQTEIDEDPEMDGLGDSRRASTDVSTTSGHLPSSDSSFCSIEGHPEQDNRLVLIVETVLRYLEDLTEQLESLGYRVVIARAGTEAIAKARSLQPCAILLNPVLPQLSGWDVLTLLKSDAQTRHIPILITATQAEKQQAYQNKADGFLSLPVQKQALQESLAGLGEPQDPPTSSLTILHLSPDVAELRSDSSVLSAELTEALSLQHSNLNYRLLEADDLEQAELLARVWHLDVILLDGSELAEPLTFLQEFSLRTSLASLPIVTLDRQTTEAANQITGLSVYPCLATNNQTKIAALLQVIQLAAGMISKPSILAVDIPLPGKGLQIAGSPESQNNRFTVESNAVGSTSTSGTTQPSCQSCNLNACTPWLQALIQYLETAGFRSLLSCSWAELYRQLQDQSIDLLLIRLTDITDASALINALIYLAQLPQRPPILILDHRSNAEGQKSSALSRQNTAATSNKTSMSELDSLLNTVATKILRGSTQSMAQLLDEIASYSR